nr:MAG TPA: hypothetical protein [Inoviridae sp.]
MRLGGGGASPPQRFPLQYRKTKTAKGAASGGAAAQNITPFAVAVSASVPFQITRRRWCCYNPHRCGLANRSKEQPACKQPGHYSPSIRLGGRSLSVCEIE